MPQLCLCRRVGGAISTRDLTVLPTRSVGSVLAARLAVKPHAHGFLERDAGPFEARSMRIQVSGVVDDQPVGASDLVRAACRVGDRSAKLLHFRNQAGRREYVA